MSPWFVLTVLVIYFSFLFLISWISVKKSDSRTFFIANRNAPWGLVAYGMIGVAISGITFIFVPGQVAETSFSYFQMVIGFSIGLVLIAYVLLPLFYKIEAVSIYSYLNLRFGKVTHKTGAYFFLFAQMATAAFKLFLMAKVLQLLLFDRLGVSFEITVSITLALIWLYTYRGGIKTVILTDTFQTTFLLLAVVLSILTISKSINISIPGLFHEMQNIDIATVFYWGWEHPYNFFKMVSAGVLLTVMTNGLDQSVMQKHLTCKNLKSSQKNIVTLAIILLFVNFLILFLGGALQVFGSMEGIKLPAQTDDIYPFLALNKLGTLAGTFFIIGVAAAAYSSADSSLTGLTTSFCVDILNFKDDQSQSNALRKGVHLSFTFLLFIIILVFNAVTNENVLSAFIRTSGFVYGPLVGLFAFGMFTKRKINDNLVPVLCILVPVISIIIDRNSVFWLNGFKFGYSILVFNSLLMFVMLYLLSSYRQRDYIEN